LNIWDREDQILGLGNETIIPDRTPLQWYIHVHI